jgi:imidazolonepropionase-like amidohydrolase
MRNTNPFLALVLLTTLHGAAWPAAATAQVDDPPPPAAYAIRGATVVSADGSRRPGLTIVVRRGLIEAIGPGVAIPPDAKLLEGDSLEVYPGLIDAYGEAEVEFPEAEIDRSELPFWAPPRAAQGFQPHRRVVDHIAASGADFEDARQAGVVAVAVHPGGALMPGRGAVLLLRKDAETTAELVLAPALGPEMALVGANGMYPSTIFGAAAVIRQGLEDARHHGILVAAHQQDPRGMKAPPWDPDYAVLREAMSGAVRVFFRADRALDIRTILGMAEEYELQPVIVGGAEAWKVAGELRARGVPVFVSLDFPEPERWQPEEEPDTAEAEEPDTAEAEEPDTAEAEEPDTAEAQEPEPLDAAEEREKQRLEDIYANAGRLAQAGVSLALTSGGGEADLLEGARKAIEYGLTEEQAVAALTSTPASLLGVGYLARVEEQMPATFVVTDGPLFDEDTKILYTFVEGELEEGKAPTEDTDAPEEEVLR